MNIIDIVESSRTFSWANIDCGLTQGEAAILKHLKSQNDNFQEDEYNSVKNWVSWMENALKELAEKITPFQLPKEYKDFLEYYGGFSIDGINSHLSVLGISTMTEDWYGYLNQDNLDLWKANICGWLRIGELVFQRNHKHFGQRVIFYLDLAGYIQPGCVVALGLWDGVNPRELDILNNKHNQSNYLEKVSESFDGWIELSIKTRGGFSYG